MSRDVSLEEQIEAVLWWDDPTSGHRKYFALRAAAATLRGMKECNLQLSRILHEMAGSVSLCWEPKPTGVFQSTQAAEFVAAAIAEIRHPPNAADEQEKGN